MLSLLRIVKFALQDIGRNLGLSFMTVLILVLMLLSVNILLVVNVLTKEATKSIRDQIDVSVYFDHEATDKQINEVKEYVQSFPEIVETKYINKEEVLAQFKEQHKENAEIISSIEELGDNPLGATLVLKTRDPSDYAKVIAALNVPEYENIIEAKTFGDTEKAINRVNTITRQVEKFGGIMSALFAAIAFLIIFNTIRVAIYTQRIEIGIKKLVGATNWFIRGPYIFESLVFTLLSVGAAVGIIYLGLHFLDPYAQVIFGRSAILTNYFTSNIILLFGIQFGAVLILTVMSSLLAMRRYLRV